MLLVEFMAAVGELDMCMCRLDDRGELGKWWRFCDIYEMAVEAMS
jgi:hypothetical protein